MVRTYRGIRLVAEVICLLLLLALILVPMAIAAFSVSVYMGVPFLCVLIAGFIKQHRYNA